MTALELRTTTHSPTHCTIDVIGPLGCGSGSALREHLRPLLGTRPGCTAELDLRCCTHLDLDGLFALAALRQELLDGGGDLRLVRVPPLLERCVRQHNFDHLLGG